MNDTSNVYDAIAEALVEHQPLKVNRYPEKGCYRPFKRLLNTVTIEAMSLIGYTRTGLLKFRKKLSNGNEKTFVSNWTSLSDIEQQVALKNAEASSVLHDYARQLCV